jgi:hypothetical protein
MNSDYYERDTLSKDYKEDILNQQKKYLTEKQNRIQKEQMDLLNEKQRIEMEDKMQEERRLQLIDLQYKDYLSGLQEKENKTQKEFQEKLIPLNTSLPMNSEQRLRSYHERVYKLSDKADLNKKLFMDYNQKARNGKFYNYLSKKYSYEKEPNRTIIENKDTSNPGLYANNSAPKINLIENKNNELNNNSNNNMNFYLKNYGAYKDVFKQYDNYNRILSEQNIRNKDFQNKQRTMDELKRIQEREKLYNFEKQEKMYENEKKKIYREYLDRQVQDNFPIKLWKENYNEKNFVNNTPFFKDRSLYNSSPNFSIYNKSNFVEVNPYNAKNYNLGNSDLEYNTILNPMFNYNYNKYLFPKKMNEILREKMRQNNYENNSRNNNFNRLETYSNTLDIKDNNRYNL